MVRPIQKIIHALNDPRFKSRTIAGIATATGLTESGVRQAIDSTSGVVLPAGRDSNDNELVSLHNVDA